VSVAPIDQIPAVYRRRIGDIVVTALSDGILTTDRVMTRNLPPYELSQALRSAFRDGLCFSVNAFLLHSRGRVALIDTGCGTYLGPNLGWLAANLKIAGVSPEEIEAVLLTHIHPDHSAGLADRSSGLPHYPNAELVVHENEPKHWFDDLKMAGVSDLYKTMHFQWAREQTKPYLDRMRTFTSGEVFPGVTAIPARGHTPGHTAFLVASRADRLLIWGDTIHIPEVQFARPEITMVPDTDPQAAAVTRRKLLEMAAQERMLVTGMHMHFPGFGHVTREGSGFRFHPEPWRQTLDEAADVGNADGGVPEVR
jgi:glyoxylase-like metal-dependent hydrolase (beta-lactamase superfamily II)